MSDSTEIGQNSIGVAVPVGAGESLRKAREAAGLHIAALAVLLKVPVKKLEALEGNRFDLLPDAVFVRALAASVCRTLKIDSAPILAQLPVTTSPKLIYQGAGINEEFRSPGQAPGPSILAQLSKPAVLAGLALSLGTLVLVFLPAIKSAIVEVKSHVGDSPSARSASTDFQKPSEESVQLEAASPSASFSASLNAASKPGATILTDSGPTAALSANGPAVVQTSVSVTVSSSAPISDSTAVALGGRQGTASPTFVVTAKTISPSDLVVFTAKGESWVEATDAKGQVVLRRMLAAGEVVGASGSMPLRVVVGRANMTQVQIRGKGFDLNPVSKDNVARFEVK